MANIMPFQGIMYNTDKIGRLADVVMPPFDVISKQDQDRAYERHPHNIIRLILNKNSKSDTENDNVHTRAAGFFQEWLRSGILVQDSLPTIYWTALEFSHGHRTVTRHGFIAAVGLEPFDKGIIVPHERTFSKVKSERLNLMKACNANFSPVFGMYSDRKKHVENLLADIEHHRPADIAFTDSQGLRHSLWRITDPVVHQRVQHAMADKKICIADGHHRYETALNYRQWLKDKQQKLSSEHPANFVMMYLTCMEDPGLVIMPAHRMLKGVSQSERDAFLQKADAYFDVTEIPFSDKTRFEAQKEFLAILEIHTSESVIGLAMKKMNLLYAMRLKSTTMPKLPQNEVSTALQALDVTILTHVVFMKILGFNQERLDNAALIGYSNDANHAIDAVLCGEFDMAFILNPTTIEQVRQVAESGDVMPRKATYFYPKVIAGLVLNSLQPGPFLD